MKDWLFFSLLALACWGLWAFFPKIAVSYLNPKSAFIYEVFGGLLVGLGVFAFLSVDMHPDVRGVVPAMLTGVAGYLGLFFFLYAVQAGKVAPVASLTALYPVITLVLAMVFLKEKISPIQWMGMGLAVVSVVLIAHE
jgi:bacterial/archaeal transporter family protein